MSKFVLRNSVLLIFLSVYSQTVRASDIVNICDRGLVGNVIAYRSGADSCEQVSSKAMATLKTLSFQRFPIGQIPKNAFDGVPLLEELSFEENDLSGLQESDFKSLSKLKILRILGNKHLTAIPKGVFASSLALEELSLESNGISDISPEAFKSL